MSQKPRALKPPCSEPGCVKPVHASGLCGTHYHRAYMRLEHPMRESKAKMLRIHLHLSEELLTRVRSAHPKTPRAEIIRQALENFLSQSA